jgi:GNAT superfamily N-acetyltransferase
LLAWDKNRKRRTVTPLIFMNSYSNEIRIIPISKETLDEAISLIQKVFPHIPDQKNAEWSFSDSLTNINSDKNYWVAVNNEGKFIGITGLYLDLNDKSVAWLGWFGVHPSHRRHGIGSDLLVFTIDEAKRRGFSSLKLYTSSDENEKAAHQLYKKMEFLQTTYDKKLGRIYFVKDLR